MQLYVRLSYTHTADSHVADDVLWCKDGSSFPVEYSSMPITKDGKIMGAMVNFKDITERKRVVTEREKLYPEFSGKDHAKEGL